MEKRLFFVVGDLLSNVLIATVAIAVTTLLIGGRLGMAVGMIIGMVVGMLIATAIGMGFIARRLGIMEVVMPACLSGMLGGMWGGMWSLSVVETLQWGLITGTGVMVAVYLLNALISGPQKLDGPTGG